MMQQWRDTCKAADDDKSGTISYKELNSSIRKMKMPKRALRGNEGRSVQAAEAEKTRHSEGDEVARRHRSESLVMVGPLLD